MKKIGIFDSGIGGLTILFALKNKYPNNEYLYVADQKYNPYGEKTQEQLLMYASRIVTFLIDEKCDEIIIACNTICATVLNQLRNKYPKIKFVDVITPLLAKVNTNEYTNVLVLATQATQKTAVYQNGIKQQNTVLATSKFVPNIEKMDNKAIQQVIEEYLVDYRNKIDLIVLGCTHYPLIKQAISAYMNVPIFDAIDVMIEKMDYLNQGLGNGNIMIYTSGDTEKLAYQIKYLFNEDYTIEKFND